MVEVKGKEGIVARVVADSIAATTGVRLTTFEIEYPRWILAEVNTHKMLSKNSMSSRAIPVNTMLEQVRSNPAVPVFWGKNKSGMQAVEELSEEEKEKTLYKWKHAAEDAATWSNSLFEHGLHKQLSNRLVEPFQRMKTVITGTEWDNFFYLRNHEAAQPEFHELARCMQEGMNQSVPEKLTPGEWHTPYVKHERTKAGILRYIDVDGEELLKEQALKISASCLAQVSYRKQDTSLDKAEDIYKKLGVGTKAFHGSCFEHCGTPIEHKVGTNQPDYFDSWEKGITHIDRNVDFWSANFKGWIQQRKLLEM